MIRILKLVISFLMFFIVLFFIGTVLTIATELPDWASICFALFGALLVGWYTWKVVSGEKMNTGVSMLYGALMLGGLSFIIGFLGPMLLSKDTGLGPLAGVFITGPLGVLLGAIGGYFFAAKQNANAGS